MFQVIRFAALAASAMIGLVGILGGFAYVATHTHPSVFFGGLAAVFGVMIVGTVIMSGRK